MNLRLNLRLVVHQDKGLREAPKILAKELRGSFEGISKRLEKSSSTRMKKDTGEERKSLTREVTGKALDISLAVYSELLHAYIDAYGLKKGIKVPYGFGSRLHRWAQRRVLFGDSTGPKKPYAKKIKGKNRPKNFSGKIGRPHVPQALTRGKRITRPGSKVKGINRLQNRERAALRLAYLTAKAIYKRGLQGSKWNTKALEANRNRIVTDLKNAISRAVNKINRG